MVKEKDSTGEAGGINLVDMEAGGFDDGLGNKNISSTLETDDLVRFICVHVSTYVWSCTIRNGYNCDTFPPLRVQGDTRIIYSSWPGNYYEPFRVTILIIHHTSTHTGSEAIVALTQY